MQLPKSKPFLKFIVIAILLYSIWEACYKLWIHPDQTLELFIVQNIKGIANFIMVILGYTLIDPSQLYEQSRTLGIDGTHGLYIADSCSGLDLFALFAIFILAYPGSIKNKLLYIPIGLLIIHLANAIRIVALCIVTLYAPDKLDFNHHYTFTIFVYAIIFLLWIVWVNRFSNNDNIVKKNPL